MRRAKAAHTISIITTAMLMLAIAPSSSAAQSILAWGPRSLEAPVTEQRFVGTAIGLPPGQEADFDVYVQGILAMKATVLPGIVVFWAYVPLDTAFPQMFPYSAFYSGDHRLTLPIVIELFQISTQTVVHRVKSSVWDRRLDPQTDVAASRGTTVSLAAQVTARGVDRLEPVLQSTLPQPSRQALNESLFRNHTAPYQELETDTNYFNFATKTCVPMSTVSSLFSTTPEFIGLIGLAAAQYTGYVAAKAAAAPTFPFCVKKADFFKPKHYEVCVGRLEGNLTSVALTGGVNAVDLEVDAAGLTSSVTLGRLDQRVDVKLRDVSIRWKDNPFCTMRPAVTMAVADTTITGNAGRDAWATCAGTNARARRARTTSPIGLPFAQSEDTELFDVRDGGLATFNIANGSRTPTDFTAACGDATLQPSVDELLRKFYDPLEWTLGPTWLEHSPDSSFAQAADRVLSSLEHGTFDASLDHEIVSDFFRFGTMEAPSGSVGQPPQPVDGAWFWLSTDAVLKESSRVTTVPETFVAPTIGPLPWSADGRSANLVPVDFDLSFSTTTAALNQVLRERSATAFMNFTMSPEAAGALSQALSVVNPSALSPLLSPTVEWRVSPTMAPFTWMPVDPPGVPPGHYPVVYHLNDLQLDAVEPGVNGAADTLLLRLRVDFREPSLGFALSEQWGHDFLEPSLTEPLFVATVVENHLPGCPMAPHIVNFAASCDRGVELAASLVLRPAIKALMTEALSNYPAPQFFDAQGVARQPQHVRNVGRYHYRNWITLYAEIPQP